MRAWLIGSAVAVAAGTAALAFVACDNSKDCDFEVGGCGGGTVPDAGPDSSTLPTECQTDPENNANCDKYAIYVAPNGTSGATGKKENPLSSIKEAINDADALHPLIYVCQGTYDEHVSVTKFINIYGGFDCQSWKVPSTPTDVEVTPHDVGIALSINGVQTPITIANLVFNAQDAKDAGDSSIAAFLVNSKLVTFKAVTLHAGTGAAGEPTTEPSIPPFDAGAPKGIDADGAAPGAAQPNQCPDAISSGGQGGDKGGDGGAGTPPRTPAPNPDVDTGAGGQGIGATDGCGGSGKGGTGAHPGAYGANGPQSPASPALGTLAADGYHPPGRVPGQNGQSGQGGGGGGGQAGAGGGFGGGGGAGGCGGQGGQGGQPGGSSFALLAFNAKVHLVGCALNAAPGGQGGHGGQGQLGQPAGSGSGQNGGCAGAQGGNGGAGAGGNGGPGGATIGVGYTGLPPDIDDATNIRDADQQKGWSLKSPTTSNAGLAGSANGSGNPGLPGAQGTVKAVVALSPQQ